MWVVEIFLQQTFKSLARGTAARPWLVFATMIVCLAAIGFGVFNAEVETDVIKLWVDDSTDIVDVRAHHMKKPSFLISVAQTITTTRVLTNPQQPSPALVSVSVPRWSAQQPHVSPPTLGRTFFRGRRKNASARRVPTTPVFNRPNFTEDSAPQNLTPLLITSTTRISTTPPSRAGNRFL